VREEHRRLTRCKVNPPPREGQATVNRCVKIGKRILP
jgi:hypothetical protein